MADAVDSAYGNLPLKKKHGPTLSVDEKIHFIVGHNGNIQPITKTIKQSAVDKMPLGDERY